MTISKTIFIGAMVLAMLALATGIIVAQDVPSVSSSNQTAIIGQVAALSAKTISIKGKKGTSEVATNTSTKAFSSKGPISVSSIKIGELVAAIATASSTGSQSAQLAQKLYVAESSPSAAKNEAISGIVTGVNESVVTIASETLPEKKFYNITANASTVVLDRDGKSMSIENVILEQRIIVVGSIDAEGTVLPKLIAVTGKP